MKRTHVLALVTTLALAAGVGSAAAAPAAHSSHSQASTAAREPIVLTAARTARHGPALARPAAPGGLAGSIGNAPPSAGAAASIRAAGLDDGGGLGSDDGGGLPGGTVAHGSIGGTPSLNAAAALRSLGGGEDDGGGALAGGAGVVHGTIGNSVPSATAASSIRALGLDS